MRNNTSGLENHTGPEMNSQCFLRTSPENRVSPRASSNHHITNGPFNKVLTELRARVFVCVCVWRPRCKSSTPVLLIPHVFLVALLFQPAFILQPTSLVSQPSKTKEPPRYEEAVKQSRNMHMNNISQVWHSTASASRKTFQSHKLKNFSVSYSTSCCFFLPLLATQTQAQLLTLLATFSGSHGNQPADGRLVWHSHREWRYETLERTKRCVNWDCSSWMHPTILLCYY